MGQKGRLKEKWNKNGTRQKNSARGGRDALLNKERKRKKNLISRSDNLRNPIFFSHLLRVYFGGGERERCDAHKFAARNEGAKNTSNSVIGRQDSRTREF